MTLNRRDFTLASLSALGALSMNPTLAAACPDFIGDMTGWLAQGKIKYREDMVEGLENAPQAFLGLFSGANFGKLVVRVS